MRWQRFLAEQGHTFVSVGDVAHLVVAPGPPDAPAPVCVDLSHNALLALEGPDARSFLQGYVTCDVDELSHDRALLAAFCNIQGRVLADVVLAEVGGAPGLWLHRSLAPRLTASLRKYLVFAKSKLRDLDDSWVSLGLLAPPADAILDDVLLSVTPYRNGSAIRVPGTAARWLLWLPIAEAQALWSQWSRSGRIGDGRIWNRLDVGSRWAHVTAATSEAFLPQMLGLTDLGAVSFTKGCYLGQEIVARAQHRGQVKRHLAAARWLGAREPQSGDELKDAGGRPVGIVIAATRDQDDRGEALVVTSITTPATAAGAAGVTFEFP